jgi:hypothetical protein
MRLVTHGLSDSDDVSAIHSKRNRPLLNLSRLSESKTPQAALESRCQGQIFPFRHEVVYVASMPLALI